jgi:translation elongation factor EF-Tu-like GTPase
MEKKPVGHPRIGAPTLVVRRITIDSTRMAMAVTPFACAKAAPVPKGVRPFQAGRLWPWTIRLIERYTDGKNRGKMITHRSPDIEAEIWFIPTSDGGKSKPVVSGYRPQHLVKEDYQTSGEHQYLDKEQVFPGETALANIWFLSPEAYPNTIWLGREIEIREGHHLVGKAKVTKIYNLILESKNPGN